MDDYSVPALVAAIDIGTTYSGYAFALYDKPEEIHLNPEWGNKLGCPSSKTPTTVLVDDKGNFVAFGLDAESRYSEECFNNRKNDYELYQHFKMHVQAKENVTKQTELDSASGQRRRAFDIYTMAIKYMKDQLLTRVKKQFPRKLDEGRIKWILTVPATCPDAVKHLLRQAAVEAGLISDVNSEKLLLALEPEAASYYCRSTQVCDLMEEVPSVMSDAIMSTEFQAAKLSFPSGTKYMVIDAGGGTVDITVHRVQDNGEVREVLKPSCVPWGGISVDDKFVKLLENIFGKQFLHSYKSEHPHHWLSILTNFEKRKKTVSVTSKSSLYIDIPRSMDRELIVNNQSIKNLCAEFGQGIKFDDELVLPYDVVQSLFHPAIDCITNHIEGQLANNKICDGLKYIILVGGFAECDLLRNKLHEQFDKACSSTIITPAGANIAILKGAVMLGLKPQQLVKTLDVDTEPPSSQLENLQSVALGVSANTEEMNIISPYSRDPHTIPLQIDVSQHTDGTPVVNVPINVEDKFPKLSSGTLLCEPKLIIVGLRGCGKSTLAKTLCGVTSSKNSSFDSFTEFADVYVMKRPNKDNHLSVIDFKHRHFEQGALQVLASNDEHNSFLVAHNIGDPNYYHTYKLLKEHVDQFNNCRFMFGLTKLDLLKQEEIDKGIERFVTGICKLVQKDIKRIDVFKAKTERQNIDCDLDKFMSRKTTYKAILSQLAMKSPSSVFSLSSKDYTSGNQIETLKHHILSAPSVLDMLDASTLESVKTLGDLVISQIQQSIYRDATKDTTDRGEGKSQRYLHLEVIQQKYIDTMTNSLLWNRTNDEMLEYFQKSLPLIRAVKWFSQAQLLENYIFHDITLFQDLLKAVSPRQYAFLTWEKLSREEKENVFLNKDVKFKQDLRSFKHQGIVSERLLKLLFRLNGLTEDGFLLINILQELSICFKLPAPETMFFFPSILDDVPVLGDIEKTISWMATSNKDALALTLLYKGDIMPKMYEKFCIKLYDFLGITRPNVAFKIWGKGLRAWLGSIDLLILYDYELGMYCTVKANARELSALSMMWDILQDTIYTIEDLMRSEWPGAIESTTILCPHCATESRGQEELMAKLKDAAKGKSGRNSPNIHQFDAEDIFMATWFQVGANPEAHNNHAVMIYPPYNRTTYPYLSDEKKTEYLKQLSSSLSDLEESATKLGDEYLGAPRNGYRGLAAQGNPTYPEASAKSSKDLLEDIIDILNRKQIPDYLIMFYDDGEKVCIDVDKGKQQDASEFFAQYFANHMEQISIKEQQSMRIQGSGRGGMPLEFVQSGSLIMQDRENVVLQINTLEETPGICVIIERSQHPVIGTLGVIMKDQKGNCHAVTANHVFHYKVIPTGEENGKETTEPLFGKVDRRDSIIVSERQGKYLHIGDSDCGGFCSNSRNQMIDISAAGIKQEVIKELATLYTCEGGTTLKLKTFEDMDRKMHTRKVMKYGQKGLTTHGVILFSDVIITWGKGKERKIMRGTFVVNRNLTQDPHTHVFSKDGDSGSLVIGQDPEEDEHTFVYGLVYGALDNYSPHIPGAGTFTNVTVCTRMDYALNFLKEKHNLDLQWINTPEVFGIL